MHILEPSGVVLWAALGYKTHFVIVVVVCCLSLWPDRFGTMLIGSIWRDRFRNSFQWTSPGVRLFFQIEFSAAVSGWARVYIARCTNLVQPRIQCELFFLNLDHHFLGLALQALSSSHFCSSGLRLRQGLTSSSRQTFRLADWLPPVLVRGCTQLVVRGDRQDTFFFVC